jgi:5'-methylthioadenosine phosphorylase
MTTAMIGVIGGSGLYSMPALKNATEISIDTPFGAPSDAIVVGDVAGVAVAFLARHGRRHGLLPSEVPYRANIYALKLLGARYVLSLSAVGSLQEDVKPLDFVLPDQFIDLTRQRAGTFFGRGAVAHVSMADPVCPAVVDALAAGFRATHALGEGQLHCGGTYVCIEGPQFSTRAESRWFQSLGVRVVGMTNMPEARLAREAQIAYATLAMVTDFDCWHPREAAVTAEIALANLRRNATRAQAVAAAAIGILGSERPQSAAHAALRQGLVTEPLDMPADTRRGLAALMPDA